VKAGIASAIGILGISTIDEIRLLHSVRLLDQGHPNWITAVSFHTALVRLHFRVVAGMTRDAFNRLARSCAYTSLPGAIAKGVPKSHASLALVSEDLAYLLIYAQTARPERHFLAVSLDMPKSN
jgi:hypothetical protein